LKSGDIVKNTALVVAFVATSLSVPAFAQLPRTPSDGFLSPHGSVAAQDDALSLEINPAGLGFMERPEFGYGYEAPHEDYREVDDRSNAFFLAWGNGSLGLGFAWQELEQPEGGALLDSYRKFTFGLGFKPHERLSAGFNVNWFGSRTFERVDDLVSWDLGLQWRIGPNVALGWLARDVNRPFLTEAEGLRSRSKIGVHIRFLEGRLQLDNEFGSVQGLSASEWTTRALIEPVGGLRLFGSAQFLTQWSEDTATFNLQQFWAGLELSLGSVGLAYAPVFGRGSDGTYLSRVSAYHWVSPNKQRTLFGAPKEWVTLSYNRGFTESKQSGFFSQSPPTFLELMIALDGIRDDDQIEGLLLVGGNSSLGYAQAWELRQAIEAVRAKGKKVIVYLAQARLRDYYIAASADEIWLYPTESFDPDDLQLRILNYRQVLEKVHVEAEFIRIGTHKSAPEGFVYDEPTEPAIAQTREVLEAIQKEVESSILRGRSLNAKTWGEHLENRPIFPTEARDVGLVDRVLYPDEIEALLKDRYGDIRMRSSYEPPRHRDTAWTLKNSIAVITVEGNIVDGRTSQGPFSTQLTSGGETFRAICEQLAGDSSVKAVVVRIDSPGGSAVASDQMYRALRVLATKKPVVASMGNMAASGGYYAAAGANTIFASPNTITGSIGIFTGKFNAEGLFRWLGLSSTPITMGQTSSSLWEPWTDDERRRVEAGIMYRYQVFLNQIASTRNQSAEHIDKSARGRVWSGSAALSNRLVDRSGGLLEAIAHAEELAGYEKGELKVEAVTMGSTGLDIGFGAKLARAFGISSAPTSNSASNFGLMATIQSILKSPTAQALLPLYYPSETPLMLPEHAIILD